MDRQALGYNSELLATAQPSLPPRNGLPRAPELEPKVGTPSFSAGSPATVAEQIVVLSREHKALLKHLETTHKMMLSGIAKKVLCNGADLLDIPEFQDELQPTGSASSLIAFPAASLIAFPEPKEGQAARINAPPFREIVATLSASTQTDAPASATCSVDSQEPSIAVAPPSLPESPAYAILGIDKNAAQPPTLNRMPSVLAKSDQGFHNIALAQVASSEKKKREAAQQDTSLNGQMLRVVLSPTFEITFALLIVANALLMAMEAQYRGMDVGFKIRYHGFTSNAKDQWPSARTIFDVMEIVFGVLFVGELLIKMAVLRVRFIHSMWNLLDTVIVGGWLLDAVFKVDIPNPMLLRLFRLVKLLRVAKLFKTFRAFDSLSILMSSIKASVSVLFWSIVLLFTVQMAAALFFFQVLEDHMLTNHVEGAANVEIYDLYSHFGSFSRAFLTMMELTLVNWTPVCRLLTENVSEAYAFPVVLYVLLVNFAAIKVITAVFIFETQKVASTDEDLLILQKSRQTARLEANFAAVFKEIDDSGDGKLTWDEFELIIHDQRVITWLAALDLDVHQCESLFGLLDDGDGTITFHEFVAGVHRLKGTARSVDLVTMGHQATEIHKILTRLEQNINSKTRLQ